MWPERQVGHSLPSTAKVKKSGDTHLLSLYVFVVIYLYIYLSTYLPIYLST